MTTFLKIFLCLRYVVFVVEALLLVPVGVVQPGPAMPKHVLLLSLCPEAVFSHLLLRPHMVLVQDPGIRQLSQEVTYGTDHFDTPCSCFSMASHVGSSV